MFFFPPIPILDSIFDTAALSLIAGILLLSLLSLSFILHLRLESRRSHHLRHFSSLWAVRLLLVSFAALWALNDAARLPFFRRRYLYPFLPSLSLAEQANLCKAHVALSLGLFEPGFFVTLLFLVDASVRTRSPRDTWAVAFVFFACFPVLLLQLLLVFFSSPLQFRLPGIFQRNFVLSEDKFGNRTVMCTYPLLNSIVFAAFGVGYTLIFLFSCWRVVSLVINKGIRVRIRVLSLAVAIFLPLQIVLLGLSSFWRPEHAAYGGVMVGMCLSVSVCAAVGEIILVIKPISDALSAGGECFRWSPADLLPEVGAGRRRMVEESQ